MKSYIAAALAGTMMIAAATAAVAATGEYDNMCTMGLALGDKVETDCSINTQIAGKTYCFGNEDAMAQFMKDPQGNLAKADSYYSSLR